MTILLLLSTYLLAACSSTGVTCERLILLRLALAHFEHNLRNNSHLLSTNRFNECCTYSIWFANPLFLSVKKLEATQSPLTARLTHCRCRVATLFPIQLALVICASSGQHASSIVPSTVIASWSNFYLFMNEK